MKHCRLEKAEERCWSGKGRGEREDPEGKTTRFEEVGQKKALHSRNDTGDLGGLFPCRRLPA